MLSIGQRVMVKPIEQNVYEIDDETYAFSEDMELLHGAICRVTSKIKYMRDCYHIEHIPSPKSCSLMERVQEYYFHESWLEVVGGLREVLE